jgi:hypothetical protein
MGPMLYDKDQLEKYKTSFEEYNKLVKLNNKRITETMKVFNKDVINIDSDDKEKLKEMAKNILASVKQNEKYSEDIEGLKIEIDHEKGMVLFRPKKITRVRIIRIPKSKYYGKKRNKMINTYHKY